MPLFAGKKIKMDQQQNMELTKDQIIQELIALLNQNQQREAANNVFEMAALIDGMEKRLESVTEELVNVRKQHAKMEQEKADKTLKVTIRKAVESLEQQCHRMKEQLFEIKEEVREKASEIVAEVKQKGKKALNKVSEFLRIKEKLQKLRNNVQKSITDVEQSIEKIDALGTGMREAVQKAANTIRVFANKPEKEYGEKKFSIRVDVLNRFRTTKDKNRIIKEMKLGEIDILIGTHRLLGKDVEFSDLGLLIIDE